MRNSQQTSIEPIYREIGLRISEIRHRRSLTQSALAALVSLSRTSIANIERGEQRIMVHDLIEIATVLQVMISRLLPEEPQEAGTRVKAALTEVADPEVRFFIQAALAHAQSEVNKEELITL